MSFTFIPASDERARFRAEIPVGGNIRLFDVPLFTFMSNEQVARFYAWGKENTDQKLMDQGKNPKAEAFNFLVNMLGIDYADEFIMQLVVGEKTQLWDEWVRLTNMPLGKSSDSSNS